MVTNREVTYTERISVAVSIEQLERLRHYARNHDTAMSIVLREAALLAIGRADLSLAKETAYTIGAMLDRPDRPRKNPARRMGVRVLVNLTREQRTAIEHAAVTRGTTISHLLRTAGLRAARIAAEKQLPRGRPIGH